MISGERLLWLAIPFFVGVFTVLMPAKAAIWIWLFGGNLVIAGLLIELLSPGD